SSPVTRERGSLWSALAQRSDVLPPCWSAIIAHVGTNWSCSFAKQRLQPLSARFPLLERLAGCSIDRVCPKFHSRVHSGRKLVICMEIWYFRIAPHNSLPIAFDCCP